MSDQANLREAAARLGAPRCARCGAIGVVRVVVTDGTQLNDAPLGCCSIACAVVTLEGIGAGAVYSTRKDGYLIARKVPGDSVYFSKPGREALEAEKRRAAVAKAKAERTERKS